MTKQTNPEGFSKEQIKQINKDLVSQKIDMENTIKDNKKSFDMEMKKKEEKMNEMERMFGTKVTTLPWKGVYHSTIKKKK